MARRVARNLDVLLRGVVAAVDGAGPEIDFLTVPACPVASQRSLCAFGLLLGHGHALALVRRRDLDLVLLEVAFQVALVLDDVAHVGVVADAEVLEEEADADLDLLLEPGLLDDLEEEGEEA